MLVFSCGFGIVKQFKTVLKSKAEYTRPKFEPGSEYRFIKKAYDASKWEGSTLAYYIGRRLTGQDRHRGDLYYNCQYEFLPSVLIPYEIGGAFPTEDFIVLDMVDGDSVFEFCKQNGYYMIVQRSGLALVQKEKRATHV